MTNWTERRKTDWLSWWRWCETGNWTSSVFLFVILRVRREEHKNMCSHVLTSSPAPAIWSIHDADWYYCREVDKFRANAGDEDSLLTTRSDMCWVSQHLASAQKGQAGEQMARRGEMQEVSGLDVAHGEDRTYGEPDRRGEERMWDERWGNLVHNIKKRTVKYYNTV